MIVRTQTVRFDANRVPMPRVLRAGYTTDHLVERLVFEVPEVSDEQTAALMLSGEYADMALLEADADGRYAVDLTADMLGEGGAVDCYVQVKGADGAVWNSGVMRLRVGELPDAGGDLADRYPTVVEQIMEAVSGTEQAAGRAQTASESAQEASESARQAAQEASGAVQELIDDEAVSAESVWSSAATVERLCPAFEASGTAVSCYPVAGYPLGVVSRMDAVQAGEGDPSPDNVRPISGHEAAVLTQNGTAYEVSFGEPVYGGSHDWSTGVCTVSHKRLVLTGEETYVSYAYWGYDGVQISNVLDGRYTRTSGICSHAPVALTTSKHNQVWIGVSTPHMYWIGAQGQLGVSTVDEVKAYIAQQYAAGNPVTVVYQTANPTTLQLTGQSIAGQEGENVISCTSGQVTVSGRADPKYVIGALETRVAALEAALVSGG